VGNLPHVLAVTPSGHHLFVTNALSGTIMQIDTSTDKVLRTIPVGNHPLGITFIQ
jgi:YVTN family beta-propeller protein